MKTIEKIKQSKLLKNTFYSFMGKIVAMVFYMLLDIVCARILNVETYAEWVFFVAILTVMYYIGWLGINNSTKVFVSKEVKQERRNACISSALILRLIGSILVVCLLFIIAPEIAKVLGYPQKYPHLLELLFLAPVIVFFNSFSEFYKALFMGLQKFKNLFVITAVEYAGYFFYAIILFSIVKRVEGIAGGYICSGITVFLVGAVLLKKITGRCEPVSWDERIHTYILPIMKYAIPIAIISIGGLILVEMDTFMLGILSTKEQVATYGIAKNFCSKATHINYALTVGVMTEFSILNSENLKEKKKKFLKVSNLNIAIAVAVSLGFLILGPFVIVLLYGNGYEMAGTTLQVLVPYYFLYSVSNFFSSFLDFQGAAKFRSLCYMSVVLINLVLNFLMIPRYGAKGAAIATSISLVPYTVLVIGGTVNKFLKLQRKGEY